MSATANNGGTAREAGRNGSALYSSLVGLTSVVILLQGVWAGLFIRQGKPDNGHWVTVHDWGARLAILLALLAAAAALRYLRHRRDLVIGSVALFVLLLLESYLGGLISDSPGAEVIHFPLAQGLIGLAVWLPMRVRSAKAPV